MLRQNIIYLPPQGGLAHLARALAWHARGDRFDSGILHKKRLLKGSFFFVFKRQDRSKCVASKRSSACV